MIGLPGEPAAHLVEVELNQDQDFVTTRHHPIVEQHAQGLTLRAKPVMPKAVLLVSQCAIKSF